MDFRSLQINLGHHAVFHWIKLKFGAVIFTFLSSVGFSEQNRSSRQQQKINYFISSEFQFYKSSLAIFVLQFTSSTGVLLVGLFLQLGAGCPARLFFFDWLEVFFSGFQIFNSDFFSNSIIKCLFSPLAWSSTTAAAIQSAWFLIYHNCCNWLMENLR